MISFILAVFFLIITPGPAVLALAGVGACFSFKMGIRFLIGLAIGHITVSILVITGLSSIIFSIPAMRMFFLIVSTGFLLFLSYKIITQGSKIAFPNYLSVPNMVDGIILQLINPKAYAVHTLIFSGFSIYPNDFFLETIWKFIVMNTIWFPIHFIWLAGGSIIKEISLKPRSQTIVNAIMGTSLLIVSILSFFSLQVL